MIQTTTNALRRISFLQLGRTLGIHSRELRGIVGSRGFPSHAGHFGGQLTWYVANVADWLESRGWGVDADAVRNFEATKD